MRSRATDGCRIPTRHKPRRLPGVKTGVVRTAAFSWVDASFIDAPVHRVLLVDTTGIIRGIARPAGGEAPNDIPGALAWQGYAAAVARDVTTYAVTADGRAWRLTRGLPTPTASAVQ